MKTALVVMAAGIGSRFGGGIKQLTPIGLNGELIIDYSIHDAIAAGFNKIVLLIREDIRQDFDEPIGRRILKVTDRLGVELAYVYQDKNDLPAGFTCPAERVKPWGTGHAVLSCRDVIDEPFCVINADDYYGKKAYRLVHNWLTAHEDGPVRPCALAGFELGRTLSEGGGVTRGICAVGPDGRVTRIEETRDLVRDGDAARSGERVFPLETPVSMNMWGFQKSFIGDLKTGFEAFLKLHAQEPKAEFLLPTFMQEMLEAGRATVDVLPTDDQWFGVTYASDREAVIESMRGLTAAGAYREDLFGDLFETRGIKQ